MTKENKRHRAFFDVLFYHLDRTGHASIHSVMNLMQATANIHGKTLGTSIHDLSKANYTWVFSRFHIKMDRYPAHYTRIGIDTWRSVSKKCFAFREFLMFDEQENHLGAATVSAALIDKRTRKPINIPEHIKTQFAPEEGRAIDDDLGSLPLLETPEHCKTFSVRLSDIDLNQHVNNTSYVDWIIESLPKEILMNNRLVSCDIGYKAEALYGDVIRSSSGEETPLAHNSSAHKSFLHRLEKEGDGTLTTTARTLWKHL